MNEGIDAGIGRSLGQWRRWPAAWAAALLVAVTLAPLLPGVAPSATAAAVDPATDFVIDGNPDGPNDFLAPYGPGTTPAGHPTTGLYYNVRTIDGGGTSGCNVAGDDTAEGGTNVGDGPIWPVGGPAPNPKTDLDFIDVAAEKVDVDGQINDIIYVGYRKCGGNGTWQTALYVDDGDGVPPSGGDLEGDVLFIFDFDPSSGAVTVSQSDLVGGNWAAPQVLSSPFVDGFASQDYGEVALNITGLDIIGGDDADRCDTVILEGQAASITGGSLSSQVKDLVVVPPFTLSNCGALTVEKVSQPDSTSADVFHYVVDQVDGETVHDDTLTPQFGEPDGDVTEIDADIQVGDVHTWDNVISQPDYQIAETLIPSGWDLLQIECTYQDIFTAGLPTTTVVWDVDLSDDVQPDDPILSEFLVPPSVLDTTGGLVNLDPASCTITNETSGLTISKIGSGDPTAEFTFDVNGQAYGPLTLDQTGDVLAFSPGTEVTITEVLPGGAPAWEAVQVECVVGDDPTPIATGTDTVTVDTVGGAVIDCVFTNEQDGRINVIKTGEPADSTESFGFDEDWSDGDLDGTADFTLQIDDPAHNSGDLEPGTHTVGELLDATNTTADPDFVLGDISCEISSVGSGDSTFTHGGDATFDVGDTDATVDLAAGDIVDCTFTNEQAGRIVIVKETDGADDTFTFTGDVAGDIVTVGGATAAGDELVADVPAGTYAVTEAVPAGWDLAAATCDDGSGTLTAGEDSGELAGIDVAAGEIVTCTFTNERETAQLTLTKNWGSAAEPGDGVTLAASGDDAVDGQTDTGSSEVGGTTDPAVITIHPGENVDLSETFDGDNVASYEDASLVCDPADAGTLVDYAPNTDQQGSFQVPGDDPADVTCTFLNERLTAELILQKAWVNGFAGDTAEVTAIGTNNGSAVATAPDPASTTIEVLSGESVDLTEVLGADNTGTYTASLECTDSDGLTYTAGDLSGTYDVPAVPEDVTCTFTNTRTSTELTLTKTWANPADGDSVDLTVTGEAGEGTGTNAGDGSVADDATLTVYSGEVVTLAEAFNPGNENWYDTTLLCGPLPITYTLDDLSGTLAVPTVDNDGDGELDDGPITCTFHNERRTADVVVAKVLEPAGDAGLFTLRIDGVDVVVDGGDGATSDPVQALVGDPVGVAEAAGTGTNLANYTSELVCDQDVVPDPNTGTSGMFDVPPSAADATITCTFTNTRKSAQLTLSKDWVTAAAGDGVDLDAVGDSGNSSPATGGSIAPDDDTDAVLTIWAGESVDLSEAHVAGNTGSYTAELSCTADGLTHTSGDLDGTFAVASDPVDVTCTFVNTRTSAQLTLQKGWVDGADGDTADLDVTNQQGAEPADGATSTADGTVGSFLDTTNVVAAEVLSGEQVSLDEVLGDANTGSYDSELSCDQTGLDPEPTAGTSGAYTMPFEPVEVTCTFTNTRTRVDLVLEKEWIDAAAGDHVALAFLGDVANPVGDSTATGASGSEVDTPVASGPVLSGETVELDELMPPDNAAVYAPSLACDDGDLAHDPGELDADLTIPSDATTDITCRWTNAAARGNIVIVKQVDGADGTFDFSGDWPDPADDTTVGDFQITTDGGSGSQSWTGVLVPPDGEPYTVTEDDPTPEYDGTNLVCEDPDGESTVDGLTGSIDLDVGETVTCTYTNTQRATITVVKDAVPDDDEDFTFTTTGDPLPDSFDLDDDDGFAGSPDPATLSNTFTSELLPADGTYGITEEPVEGWALTQATCDNGDSPDQIDPAPGSNVTCTFVNEAAPGDIVVTKTVEGVADDFAWSFDIAIDPVDTGVDSPQQVSGVGNTSDSVTFAPLTLNRTYTIDEPDLPAGWDQVSFVCDDVDADPATPGHQVTITEPGQVVDCAIVNEARPSQVEVAKTVTGVADDFAWAFEFTIAPATDGEDATQVAAGTGNDTVTVGWANLVPGQTYTIAETSQAGWTAGELVCVGIDDSDDDPQSVTFVAPLDTDAGAPDITCSISNEADPRSLQIRKSTVGGDGEFTFAVTRDGGTPTEHVVSTTDGAGSVTIDDLVPGSTVTVSEVDPGPTWVAGDLGCEVTHVDDSTETVDPIAGFEVAPGDSVTCTITNTAQGTIVIAKNVDGDDGTFDFTGTLGDFAITTVGSTGAAVFEHLTPGSYDVAEVDPTPDWLPDGAVCVDSMSDGTASSTDGLASMIELDPGETVTCTYGNTQSATVIVDKVTVPAGDPTGFDFQFGPLDGDATDFQLADDDAPAVFGGLAPGDHLLQELAMDGWVLTDLSCDSDGAFVDGDQATVTLQAGDVVTCTYTNALRGSLFIDKVVTSGDEPVDNGDGTWTVDYDVTVWSESFVDEPYDLTDELRFGDGIEVVSASVSSGDVPVNPDWDGIDVLEVTDGPQVLPVGATHTFHVETLSTIDSTTTSSARDCDLDEGEDGTGFLNEATVNPTARACVPAPDAADVAIAKTGTMKVILPSEGGRATVTYTLGVTNHGPSAARDVQVADVLPDEVDLDQVTPSTGTCEATFDGFACDLGLVDVGDVITITVTTTTVDGIAAGEIVNTAEVTTTTPDPDTSNNVDDHVTTIERQLPRTGAAIDTMAIAALLLVLAGAAMHRAGTPTRRRGTT